MAMANNMTEIAPEQIEAEREIGFRRKDVSPLIGRKAPLRPSTV
jgi:hypothetical protein